ncbi:MAG: hypothetical protein ACE5KF_05945 [Kiloniellaceae bacterium]
MVSEETLDPIMERLIRAWHDAEAIRDMPELFTEDKLAQIAGAAMAAIEEAWEALGHTKRELEDAYARLLKSGKLENWAGKKHVGLD